ncbi:MAG: DUF72 domain-containing protein [Isosphaeraceae bacterium]
MDSLFPEDPPPQAARLAPKLRALADRGLYFGTSSWKYEGWLGSIYDEARYRTRGKPSKKKFEDTCLAEYAATFPTVCGDFAFYQFPTEEYWARLFDPLPGGFLMGLKVPEEITVAAWPGHALRGPGGLRNEHFLDAEAFVRFFLKRLSSHSARVGPIIFEFSTFNKSTFATTADFLDRLGPFLDALPKGPHYAVEVRNPEYLGPAYFGTLADRGVAHAFNAWTRMPALDDMATVPEAFTADFTVVRALLRKGRNYEDAVKQFEPYRAVREPNEGARLGMIGIARLAQRMNKPAFVYVNNRLEGNAPGTIEAVADELIA